MGFCGLDGSGVPEGAGGSNFLGAELEGGRGQHLPAPACPPPLICSGRATLGIHAGSLSEVAGSLSESDPALWNTVPACPSLEG